MTRPCDNDVAAGTTPPGSLIPARARYIWRNVQSGEAQFFKQVGHWDITAGFFKGFGLGVTIQQGEWDLTIGPFSVGAVRD